LSVPDDTIEQLALFQESAMHPNEKHVLDELSDLALEDCTPMQAMLMLDSWKKLLKSQKSR
jgi:DNA mismatch repair protein MutS